MGYGLGKVVRAANLSKERCSYDFVVEIYKQLFGMTKGSKILFTNLVTDISTFAVYI